MGLDALPRPLQLVLREGAERLALYAEVRLHLGEAPPELLDRVLQGLLGVDRGEPRRVHEGEQHIAQLLPHALDLTRRERRGGLADLFFHLYPRRPGVRPVEVHARRLGLDALSAQQRGQRPRDAVDRGAWAARPGGFALLAG